MSEQIISQEGYDKLKAELDMLVNVKRKEIAKRIQAAKDMGDLSENAEYSEAKDAQAFNDGRIIEITSMLKNLTVVANGTKKDSIGMGSKIIASSGDKEKEFLIVSFNESDPANGMISNESPLGKAFLDKKQGDEVMVETPKGVIKYKIMKIE